MKCRDMIQIYLFIIKLLYVKIARETSMLPRAFLWIQSIFFYILRQTITFFR
jgi:hypothetical protein